LQEATPEELALIKQLGLHLAFDELGFSALHYAVCTRKTRLVQQLLEIGADSAAYNSELEFKLTPLHLACLGRVKDEEQLNELWCLEDDNIKWVES
jgi:ankyrin repeat protein